ncbi:ABC-three component system protein [Lelliottia nimipressuralis]|uniref:ABC-three component system protein n=1 Tax=Lelliottia nimipressuralis TaxID=69220 RepID=UPI00289EACB1|nr:ABC-three component system protein [Lelliottia nimipressuralis]
MEALLVEIRIILTEGVVDVFSKQEQSGNRLTNGSIVGGDQHNTITNIVRSSNRTLDRLYVRLSQGEGVAGEQDFSDKLKHYLATDTNPDIRDLETKLIDSKRSELIFFATDLKEKAFKAIMKCQSSKTAQEIYALILDKIHTDFMLKVTPLIQSDGDRVTVDDKISVVLESISEMLGDNLLDLSEKDLLGLLYFLGGNCHVRWDKC